MWKRITKREARKLWEEGKEFYLIPSKMRIGSMWHVECQAQFNDDYKESALGYKRHFEEKDISSYSAQYAHLWKGDIYKTSWDLMYNNWAYYNTNYEMGYYAHYYIKE